MKKIPYNRPDISWREIWEVVKVLHSGWITTGGETHQFEEECKQYLGAKYAIALNSCTAGLELALKIIDLQPGDEVIVPIVTFAATANVVEHLGGKPVFVDIEDYNFNIDPEKIEAKITSRTKAIIPVHFGGNSVNLEAIRNLGKKYNLHVIEDAAHGFGGDYKGVKIGQDSEFAVFSFYATKNLTTAEGGLLVTNNEEYANLARVLSLHGLSKDAWKRYSGGSWKYDIIAPGYKYNMTNIQAALGRVQLRRFDGFTEKRWKIAEAYEKYLKDIPGLKLPEHGLYGRANWHLYPILIDKEKFGLHRDQVIEELNKSGVGTSVFFIPFFEHSFYRGKYNLKAEDYPVAQRIFSQTMALPLFTKMSIKDVKIISDIVRKIHSKI